MKFKIIIFALLFILVCMGSKSQAYNKVGSTAAQFLKIEAGPRALGMAGTYTAIADGPYALYWNVAGLAQVKNISASLSYTNWIADLRHGFAAVIFPAGSLGNLGLSVTTLTGDKIEQTTIESPHGTGTYVDAYDIALGVSYARFMTEYVSVGLTGKYIQQKLWDLSASAFAFDIGFLLHTGFRGIKLGMTLSNIGTEMQMSGENLIRAYDKWPENNADPNVQTELSTSGWPLPTSYRVGVAVDLLGNGESNLLGSSDTHALVAAIDALHPSDNPEHYAVGVEYGFEKMFFLRAGYRGGTDEQGLTLGAGIRTPVSGGVHMVLDYAYADFGVFDFIQQFSLGFTF